MGVKLHRCCRRDGKAITLSHDALLVALVNTAPHVKQAADDKLKPISVELDIAADESVRLSLSPSKLAASGGKDDNADAAQTGPPCAADAQADATKADLEGADTVEAIPDGDVSMAEVSADGDDDDDAKSGSNEAVKPSASSEVKVEKAAPKASGKGKGNQAEPYAPGAGKRSDLTFLDPMNKADCPPKAIALAAGELVLRVREEKRRRKAGGINGKSQLPMVHMSGSTPGTLSLLVVGCSKNVSGNHRVIWQSEGHLAYLLQHPALQCFFVWPGVSESHNCLPDLLIHDLCKSSS